MDNVTSRPSCLQWGGRSRIRGRESWRARVTTLFSALTFRWQSSMCPMEFIFTRCWPKPCFERKDTRVVCVHAIEICRCESYLLEEREDDYKSTGFVCFHVQTKPRRWNANNVAKRAIDTRCLCPVCYLKSNAC